MVGFEGNPYWLYETLPHYKNMFFGFSFGRSFVFAWFFKGQQKKFVARYQGKYIIPPDGAVTQPGLYAIEITRELPTSYRADILDQAAMLEMPENGESGSVRLQLAVEAFGPFEERSVETREGKDPVIRVFWIGIAQQEFDREINRRVEQRGQRKEMRFPPALG